MISPNTDAWIRTVSRENAAQAEGDERCVPVIPCEDEPIHTLDHPFCDDPKCPCHHVVTDEDANEAYWRLICEPMKNGLMTAQEATRIFFNEQI